MSLWRTQRDPESVLAYITKRAGRDSSRKPLVFEGKSQVARREMKRIAPVLANRGLEVHIEEHPDGTTSMMVQRRRSRPIVRGADGVVGVLAAPLFKPIKGADDSAMWVANPTGTPPFKPVD